MAFLNSQCRLKGDMRTKKIRLVQTSRFIVLNCVSYGWYWVDSSKRVIESVEVFIIQGLCEV